jgi:hypothetical protein
MARRSGDRRRGDLYGYGLPNWARQDPASIAGGSPANRRELARIPQAQPVWDGDENDAVLLCFRVAEVSRQLDFGCLPVQPELDKEVSVAGFERPKLSDTFGWDVAQLLQPEVATDQGRTVQQPSPGWGLGPPRGHDCVATDCKTVQ